MTRPRQPVSEPEVLPPRSERGSSVLSDENLELLAHVLDDWLRIPGTSVRFGLDAIVGLVPVVGDVAGGIASCVMLAAAWSRGVPYIGLTRMAANIGIEVIVGSIPFVGDAFDVAWKANRRNYRLLTRHVQQPRRYTWRDWGFLVTLCAAVGTIFALPLILFAWILAVLIEHHLM